MKKIVKEENKSGDSSLHDWFSKSKSSDGKRGWVQLGGRYAGKSCAKQPGQTTKPKCGSSKMAANMSDKEEDAAARRKREQDPDANRSGQAINVPTEGKRKMKEEWSQKYKNSINCSHPKGFSQKAHCAGKKKQNESTEMEMTCEDCGMCQTHGNHSHDTLGEACWAGYEKKGMKTMFGKRYPNCVKKESIDEYIAKSECPECGGHMVSEDELTEEKDACYHKVKSRYSVWPSAYASGALVKCRKAGAANWGNKTKQESTRLLSFGAFIAEAALDEDEDKVNARKMYHKHFVASMKSMASSPKQKHHQAEMAKYKAMMGDSFVDQVAPKKFAKFDKKTNEEVELDEAAPFKDLSSAVKYGSDKVKTHRDHLDGIEVYKHKDGGYDVNHTMNASGRNSLNKSGAKHLGTIYRDTQGKVSHDIKEEVELDEVAAWQRKEGKNSEGGLNRKGIESYRAEHPGSHLSMAVTTKPSKLKAGSKAANRRKSFCARMSGMKRRLTSAKTAHDPNSRINKSLRKWNC
jgi:hypothetical protein